MVPLNVDYYLSQPGASHVFSISLRSVTTNLVELGEEGYWVLDLGMFTF